MKKVKTMLFPFLIIVGVIAAVRYHRDTRRWRPDPSSVPLLTSGGSEPAFEKPVRSVDDAIADLIDQGLIDDAMLLADMYPDDVQQFALPDGEDEKVQAPAGELEDIGEREAAPGEVEDPTAPVAPIKSPFEDITDEQWAELVESLKMASMDHRDGKTFGAWRQPFASTASSDAILPTLDSQRSAFSQWLGSALSANESVWRDLVNKNVEFDGVCVPVTRSGAIAVFRCAGKKVDRWLAGDRGRHTTEAFNNSNGLF